MSDTDRVRAWRDRLKQAGRVPMTIWVMAETKARYEDLALTYHRSPSELAQQALDAYRPDHPSVSASVTDAAQLRALIQAELAQLTDQVTVTVTARVTDTATATVTAAVTETLVAQLPGLVQAAIAATVSASVTATDTVTPPGDAVAARVTDTVTGTETATAAATKTVTPPLRHHWHPPEPTASGAEAARASAAVPPRRGGRPPSRERQQILALLEAHPDGLSAEELRVYVKPAKPLGDTLQGMRKSGVLRTREDGKTLRYVRASHPHP
jgi:hypothetical protein